MKLIVIIIISLISFNAFSYDLKGRIVPVSNIDINISEGDYAKIKLQIWPINSIDPKEFREFMLSNKILSFFHIVDIVSVEYSKNNSEVLEVIMNTVLTKKINTDALQILSYKGLNIPLEFANIKTTPNPEVRKDFIILDRSFAKNLAAGLWEYFLIMTAGVILVVCIFFIRRYSIKAKKTKSNISLKKKWRNDIELTKTREGYELLFKEINQWRNFYRVESVDNLLDSINKLQYKKIWSDTELKDLLEYKEKMLVSENGV